MLFFLACVKNFRLRHILMDRRRRAISSSLHAAGRQGLAGVGVPESYRLDHRNQRLQLFVAFGW
jgi:hypothetical protein